MTAVNDLRILAVIAEHVDRHGVYSHVFNAVRSAKTERGKLVAKAIVDLVQKLRDAEGELVNLRATVENLRNDMDRASDEILRLERLVRK